MELLISLHNLFNVATVTYFHFENAADRSWQRRNQQFEIYFSAVKLWSRISRNISTMLLHGIITERDSVSNSYRNVLQSLWTKKCIEFGHYEFWPHFRRGTKISRWMVTDLMRQHQGVSLKISKTYLNARKSKQLCHSAVRGLLHQPTLCLGKKLYICRAPETTWFTRNLNFVIEYTWKMIVHGYSEKIAWQNP